jgi:uncharacterized protein
MRRAVKDPSPSADRAPKLSYKLDELDAPRELDVELGEDFLSKILTDAGSIFRAQGSGRLTGELVAVDDGALLRGQMTCHILLECGRCLAPVSQELAFPITVRYVPRPKLEARAELSDSDPKAEKAGSFDPRDLDEEPLENHRVDLHPAIREQLLLALPMGLFCPEECKGLCGSCGRPLSEGSCDCKGKPVDPRWERLKELKVKS